MSDDGNHSRPLPISRAESEELDGPPSPLIERRPFNESDRDRDGAISLSSNTSRDLPGKPRARRRSSTSVDVGYFDPSGVEQLRRSLRSRASNLSQRDRNAEPSAARHPTGQEKNPSQGSEETLFGAILDGNFDLEKTMRNVFNRCAYFP
jgi:hypothetical protein